MTMPHPSYLKPRRAPHICKQHHCCPVSSSTSDPGQGPASTSALSPAASQGWGLPHSLEHLRVPSWPGWACLDPQAATGSAVQGEWRRGQGGGPPAWTEGAWATCRGEPEANIQAAGLAQPRQGGGRQEAQSGTKRTRG